MVDSISVLILKPPYGTEEAFAGMRECLAMMVSGLVERPVTVFMREGILNAVATQDSAAIAMPSNKDALQDLIDLDIEVYVVKEDLEEIAPDAELVEGVQVVDRAKAREVISSCEVVNTF